MAPRIIRHVPLAKLLIAGELLMLAREHVLKLEADERRRLIQLVRKGRGRKGNLSEDERRELARLLEKVEPRLFMGNAARKAAGFRTKGSRRNG
jgi:hypothetical protein